MLGPFATTSRLTLAVLSRAACASMATTTSTTTTRDRGDRYGPMEYGPNDGRSVCGQDSDKSSDSAFQAWLRSKAKQHRVERKRVKYEREDIEQVSNYSDR